MEIKKENNKKQSSSYKMILLFGMVSITMMFAGLTSAFIVSKSSRTDWLKDFQLPSAFYFSSLTIILCSITFHLAKKSIQKNNQSNTSKFLLITLILGILFVILQFVGFNQIIKNGYYFTGSGSSITATFLYIVAMMHLLHLAGGIISLLIIIYNNYKQKYNSTQTTGIELGAMYWHFLDFLWIGLFLFLYFFK